MRRSRLLFALFASLLLSGVLLRPAWQGGPVQAQGVSVTPNSSQMVLDKDNAYLYVMMNGKVYAYLRVDEGRRWVLWQTLNPAQEAARK